MSWGRTGSSWCCAPADETSHPTPEHRGPGTRPREVADADGISAPLALQERPEHPQFFLQGIAKGIQNAGTALVAGLVGRRARRADLSVEPDQILPHVFHHDPGRRYRGVFLDLGCGESIGKTCQRGTADHQNALGEFVSHDAESVVELFELGVQLVESFSAHAPVVVVQFLGEDDGIGEQAVQGVDDASRGFSIRGWQDPVHDPSS